MNLIGYAEHMLARMTPMARATSFILGGVLVGGVVVSFELIVYVAMMGAQIGIGVCA